MVMKDGIECAENAQLQRSNPLPPVIKDEAVESDMNVNRSSDDARRTENGREDDSEVRLKRARSRFITVEIPLALTTLSYRVLSTLEAEYVRERVAAAYNTSLVANASLSSCDVNVSSHHMSGLTENEIQSRTSTWLLYLGIAMSLPSFFVAICLGSLSDRLGRKPALFLSIFGFVIQSCIDLVVVYFSLPLTVFIAGDFMLGLCGAQALMLATCAAYITDVTSERSRTLRIILLETVFYLASGIGQIALGFTLQFSTVHSFSKYMFPLWISLGCSSVALIYVATPDVLLETVARHGERSEAKLSGVVYGIIDMMKVNTNGRRTKIILYNLVMVCAVISSRTLSLVTVVYSLGEPFCFQPLMVALLQVAILASPALGMIVGGPLLPRVLRDNWILQLSMWNYVVIFLFVGFAGDTLLLFIGVGVGIFTSICFPIIRARLSKISGDHERGLMLAIVGCMDSVGLLFTPLISNSIYSATVFFFPPFVFFFLAAFQVLPILMTGLLQGMEWQNNHMYEHPPER